MHSQIFIFDKFKLILEETFTSCFKIMDLSGTSTDLKQTPLLVAHFKYYYYSNLRYSTYVDVSGENSHYSKINKRATDNQRYGR